MQRTLQRSAAAAITGTVLLAALSCAAPVRRPPQRTFATPEDAVRTLIDVVKAGKIDELLLMFGEDGEELAASSDPATGRQNRQVFTAAVAEGWQLVDQAPGKKTLIIGNEQWPFPIPLVRESNEWRFDTAAGKEEVLARRIGRNELSVIQTCRTYVVAQQVYALRGHDGKPAGLFAKAFRSEPGRENGLYWPVKRGERLSPLGDLVAQAEGEGRSPHAEGNARQPFHGYYFKILTAQGPHAPGGTKDYILNGELAGGFALVAWPAEYDSTGIMTFIVNHDGVVHEADLGAGSGGPTTAISRYDPDPSWKAVK